MNSSASSVGVSAKASASSSSLPPILEIMPKAGLVYSEKGTFSETLCRPKLLAIKSLALEKLEQLEKSLSDNASGVR